jgi:hypothetical protein
MSSVLLPNFEKQSRLKSWRGAQEQANVLIIVLSPIDFDPDQLSTCKEPLSEARRPYEA